jgi:Bacterial extracellular solute-binding protein
MIWKDYFRVLTVVTFFAVLGVSATAYTASVEEQFDQINRLSDKARAETSEKEARKEGEVVWYAAMASDRAAELIKAFEGKYPFLKVRFQPGGASRQIELLMVEHRTKKHRADVINTRRSFVGVMAKEGAVARYRTPARASLRDGFTDKEGFVNSIYAQPRVFLFNPRMVPRDRAPKSMDDLLDARWKDKLGMDTTDYDWLASLIEYYGRNKALEFAGRLAKQQLNMRRGPTLLTQLAVAGGVSGRDRCISRRGAPVEKHQSAGRLCFFRALCAGENTDDSVDILGGAPSLFRGSVRGFSSFQARPGSDGWPRALGEQKGRRISGRPQGEENADPFRRMGR